MDPRLEALRTGVEGLIEAHEGLVVMGAEFAAIDRARVEGLNAEYLRFLSEPGYSPEFETAKEATRQGLAVLGRQGVAVAEEAAKIEALRSQVERLEEGEVKVAARDFLALFQEQHLCIRNIVETRRRMFEVQIKNLERGLQEGARWEEVDWRPVEGEQEKGKAALEAAVEAYGRLTALLRA
ncbi:MAG: hypothetical protein HY555_05125 [Euryarchaeota archaeon]|nr:hypothetical protein [Euryarchaeota archaeon]